MIKILFVCHGNICRSPMAEFIMKDIVRKKGCADKFIINSRGVSDEEEGEPLYPLAFKKLDEKDILIEPHRAKQITEREYHSYDYIIAMDDDDVRMLNRLLNTNNKIYKLLYFIGNNCNIADPWYTHDFEVAYEEIYKGCLALYTFLDKNNKIY